MGGAILPLTVGPLGDAFGLRAGMTFLHFTFGWVLCVSLSAKPLIVNVTLRSKR